MAAIQVDVRPGPNGPIYVVTGPAGNTVTINDYMHGSQTVSGTGTTTPTTDGEGNKGQRHAVTL